MRKFRDYWPVAAIVLIVVGTMWPMWVVWQSPQRSDLEAFGSFAAPILGAAVSLIIYLAKIRQSTAAGEGRPVDKVADLLAAAVKEQWIGAAADRRLLQPEPIPVRWEDRMSRSLGRFRRRLARGSFRRCPGWRW
jgi:hypothetical protein